MRPQPTSPPSSSARHVGRARWTRAIAPLVVVGLAAATVVAMAGGSGVVSSQVGLAPGWAWFMSPKTGQLALIDGPTGVRVAKVTVAEPDDDVVVAQAGSDAIVVNRTTGTARRVDASTFEPGPPQQVASPADEHFAVVANEATMWAVTQNGTLIQQLDSVTGAPLGPPVPFRGTVDSAAITADGTLWAASLDGTVASYRDGALRTDHTVEAVTGAQLVIVDDRPTLVDIATNRIETFDPGSGRPSRRGCLSLGADAVPLIAGTTSIDPTPPLGVLAVTPTNGILVIADPDPTDGRCSPVVSMALGDPATSPRYGRPAEHAGRIFVPDHEAGTVIVVHISHGTGTILGTVPLGLEGGSFELLVHNGYAWFDDPVSDEAGVIHDDLTARRVSKSADDPDPVTPGDDEPDPDSDTFESPLLACRATPSAPLPGQRVTITAPLPPDDRYSPQDWVWTTPQTSPEPPTGPQTTATWSEPGGPHIVTATAESSDGTAPISARCNVTVTEVPPPPPPPSSDPPTSEPPDTTPPDSTMTSEPPDTTPTGTTLPPTGGDADTTTSTVPETTTTTTSVPDTTTTTSTVPETTTTTSTSVPEPETPVATALALGIDHTCALMNDTTIRCWGANTSGQLGDGTTTTSARPVTVQGLPGVPTSVTAGGAQTCALLEDRTVACWGQNNRGQLGDSSTADSATPIVVAGITNATAIVAGHEHTCALLEDRTVRCWGSNQFGQLGNNSLDSSSTPVVVTGSANYLTISSGTYGHTCALVDTTGDNVHCWGHNGSGELGRSTFGQIPGPVPGLHAKAVIAGDELSCALLADDSLSCWGWMSDGGFASLSPVPIEGLPGPIAEPAPGYNRICARTTVRTVYCRGDNRLGQLGTGTTTDSLTPLLVVGITTAESVVAGMTHTCALLAGGVVVCWGADENRQLGPGGDGSFSTTPVVVPFV